MAPGGERNALIGEEAVLFGTHSILKEMRIVSSPFKCCICGTEVSQRELRTKWSLRSCVCTLLSCSQHVDYRKHNQN